MTPRKTASPARSSRRRVGRFSVRAAKKKEEDEAAGEIPAAADQPGKGIVGDQIAEAVGQQACRKLSVPDARGQQKEKGGKEKQLRQPDGPAQGISKVFYEVIPERDHHLGNPHGPLVPVLLMSHKGKGVPVHDEIQQQIGKRPQQRAEQQRDFAVKRFPGRPEGLPCRGPQGLYGFQQLHSRRDQDQKARHPGHGGQAAPHRVSGPFVPERAVTGG